MAGPADIYGASMLPVGPAPQRPSGLGEVISSSFDLARDDTVGVQEQRTNARLQSIYQAIHDVNGKIYDLSPSAAVDYEKHNGEEKMWADLAEIRRARPDFLKGVPGSRAELAALVLKETKERRARDKRVVENAEGAMTKIAGFGGSVAGAMTDPINIMTLPFGGGGKTVFQAAAREALFNGVIETVEQPIVAQNREVLGEELTTGEAVANVLTATAGGALFGGGFKAVELHGGKVAQAAGNAYDATVERVFNALPEKWQGRWADAMEIPDDVLPDLAREMIGAERLTPDERAAIHVIETQAEIANANPFFGGATASEHHHNQLAETMRAIMEERPVPAFVRTETALSTGTVPAPRGVTEAAETGFVSRDALKAAIGRAENASGGLMVKNPNSSATGPYQFTRGTWISTYRQRFGETGMSDDAIWDLRTSGRDIHEALMDTLINANARALKKAGFAETKGNLYLAHFAGDRGALALLRADPATPVEQILSREAIAANRSVLEGKTAGDVIVWAHRKVSAKGEPVAVPREAGDSADALRAEADALQAEAARIRETQAEARGGDADPLPAGATEPDGGARASADGPVAPIDVEDVLAPAPVRVPASAGGAMDDAVLVGRVLEIARARTQSLDPVKLAQVLEISEDQARRALNLAAARPDSGLTISQKGTVRRLPRVRGPEDAITFLARRGGLSPDGVGEGARKLGVKGHDLAGTIGARRMVGAFGPLLRKSGRDLDSAGELLHEAGFFGPPSATERPTEADVIDFLERALREKTYAIGEDGAVAQAGGTAIDAAARDEISQMIDSRLAVSGIEFDADDMAEAVALIHQGGRDVDDAILEVIHNNIEDARLAAVIEADELAYDDWDALWRQGDERSQDQYAGRDSERPTGSPRDAGQGGAWDAEFARAGEDADWLDARWEIDPSGRFDDPHGLDAKAQADSLEHDARMAVDPAIAERQRQEAQLRAQAPLQGGAKTGQAQDGTMGLGLFDAADQPTFRLDDGDERSLADLLDDIAGDEDAIAKARGCMAPPKMEGGA